MFSVSVEGFYVSIKGFYVSVKRFSVSAGDAARSETARPDVRALLLCRGGRQRRDALGTPGR